MTNLEQDLMQSQQKIVSLLTQYQKVSEDIIKSNYNNQLHNLLNTITTFDHARIRQCQTIFQDEAIVKYIHTIADIVKHKQEVKPSPQSINTSQGKKKEEVKREPRIAEKKEQQKKSGGLFDFVRNKFASKEKKPTEMILPNQQPKCYYDHTTKSWIFQGEQPEAPKVIPKPPSAAQKKVKEQTKKVSLQDKQVDQMTAPPAFKRKSTPGVGNVKGKAKIKQSLQIIKSIEQPLNFAKMVELINATYSDIIEKARSGVYDKHIEVMSSNNMGQFLDFAEKTLQVSQEIKYNENKVIEKWSKLLASESRDLKIMQKVLKEIEQSANIYHSLALKLNHSDKQRVFIKEVIKHKQPKSQTAIEKIHQANIEKPKSQTRIGKQQLVRNEQLREKSMSSVSKVPIKIDKECQTFEQRQQRLQDAQQDRSLLSLANEQIFDLKQKIDNMLNENDQLNEAISKYQVQLQKTNNQIQHKEIIISQLKDQQFQHSKSLTQQLKNRQSVIRKLELQLRLNDEIKNKNKQTHTLQIKQLNDRINEQKKSYLSQIKQLQLQNTQLNTTKLQLEQQLVIEKAKGSTNIQKVNFQLNRQRTQIQSQLKFYEQKQKIYLGSIKQLQQQINTIQQFQCALSQQNQLLSSILQKRLQIANRNPESEEYTVIGKKYQESPSNSVILELSNIVNSITQTHLDRLQAFNRSYLKLQKKYVSSKETVNKLKHNSANENMSLNRSVSKLKNLLQTYKAGKDQAEERCSQLQLECDKLKKRLHHYKQEDEFNKSYLSKLKIHSQNQSALSLQSDKQELASEIDELRKELNQRDSLLKKNQTDLQDLLVNYERNQTRLMQVEKKWKENQKELRIALQRYQEQNSKNKLLELKLQNQKQKCEEIQIRQESRLKNAQNNFEKRLKLMKNEVDELRNKQIQLNREVEQLHCDYRAKLNMLHVNKQSNDKEQNKILAQKDNQVTQLLLALEQNDKLLQVQKEQKTKLQTKIANLLLKQKELTTKINEVVNQHIKQITIHQNSRQHLTSIISTLNEKLNLYKEQSQQFQQEYSKKIIDLARQLQLSNSQAQGLITQINQYSQLIHHLSQQLDRHNEHKMESEQLKKLVLPLKKEIEEKRQENQELQEVIESISQDMARLTNNSEELKRDKIDLQQKVRLQQRSMQTLINQNNNRSEELMIKTQQLLQKDRIVLQLEQQSVTKKEELDEVKNQIYKMNQQLDVKQKKIKQLQADLQQLAQELQAGNTNQTGIAQLKHQLTSLTHIIEDQDKQIQALTHINNQHRRQQQINEQELKTKQDQIEEFQTEIQELNNIVIQINKEVQSSTNIIAQLSLQIQSQKKHTQQLNRSLAGKDKEISFLLERLQGAQRQISKQIDQTDEVQAEMELLLKQIESKDNQLLRINSIVKEKDQQILSLTNNKKALEHTINQLQIKISDNNEQIHQLKLQASLHIKQLTSKLQEVEQMMELIDTLSKQIDTYKEKMDKQKDKQKVIKDLTKDIRVKDSLLLQKQGIMEAKEREMNEYSHQKAMKQQQVTEVRRLLSQKSKLITRYQIAQQQSIRNIQQLNKNIKEQDQKINDLQDNLVEMAEIIQKQQKVIQSLKLQSQIQDNQQVKNLTTSLQQKNHQVAELKKRIQQISKRVSEKQVQFQNKIESLEREIINLNSLKATNKRLEQKIKDLDEYNTSLQSDKVELIKSNNYLVGINQKLIEDKSPQKKQPNKQAAKGHKNEKEKVEVAQSKESVGFFASLFLTPSETKKLSK